MMVSKGNRLPPEATADLQAAFDIGPTRPKFQNVSDSILLICWGIEENSVSRYWQQSEQLIGPGLQRSGVGHLLKGGAGIFRLQGVGDAGAAG